MFESLNSITEDYPSISALIHFGLAIIVFIIFIGKNQSYISKKYSAASWKALMSAWLVVILLIVRGIIILIRET